MSKLVQRQKKPAAQMYDFVEVVVQKVDGAAAPV